MLFEGVLLVRNPLNNEGYILILMEVEVRAIAGMCLNRFYMLLLPLLNSSLEGGKVCLFHLEHSFFVVLDEKNAVFCDY